MSTSAKRILPADSCDVGGIPNFLAFIMDLVDIEAWSFIRQEITHHLIQESRLQGHSKSVVDAMVQQFSVFAPTQNQCFQTAVLRCVPNIHMSQH